MNARPFVGNWRGRWTGVLRPEFQSNVDSSPIWLEFKLDGGRLTGQATLDYISLDDGRPGTKILTLGKREIVSLSDVRLEGTSLFFKHPVSTNMAESKLEIVGQDQATLASKEGKEFKSWVTLARTLS